MLKSEEKRHTKVSRQTETEKKFLLTKQLAQKEEATREKLRELKELMRKSREQAYFGLTAPPAGPAAGSEHPSASRFGAWTEDSTHTTEANSPGFDQTFVVGKPESPSSNLTLRDLESERVPGDSSNSLPPRSDASQTETSHAAPRVSNGQPPPQHAVSGAPSHSSSRADLKWEAAYARPSTSHSVRSQEWAEPPQKGTSPSTARVSAGGHILSSSINAVPSPELVKGESNGAVSSNSNSSEWSGADAENVGPVPRVSSLQGKLEGAGGGNSDSVDSETESGRPVGDRAGVGSRTDTYSSHHHGNGRQQHASSGEDVEELKTSSPPTVMPSQYVHSMHSRDKFDARKMGLSSKTFDSALSAMLGEDESRAVSYGSEFYDKFARDSKPPARNGVPSRSPERHVASHRSSERRTATVASGLPKDHSGVTSVWGPEAKNSSVAKRLAQFLAEDKGSQPRSRAETTSSTKTAKSVSFLERLTELQEQGTPADTPHVSSPRIQALQDTQRESTYMGRIQAEKERVAKIRQARQAAEAIQRAWRRHCRNAQ